MDSQTRRCLECHDGVNAGEAKNMTPWDRSGGDYGNRTTNHPVGVPYPAGGRMSGDSRLKPTSLLPATVVLPGGMVSCVSCHDLYGRDRHYLTVALDGSALCYACHAMD